MCQFSDNDDWEDLETILQQDRDCLVLKLASNEAAKILKRPRKVASKYFFPNKGTIHKLRQKRQTDHQKTIFFNKISRRCHLKSKIRIKERSKEFFTLIL